MNEVVGHNSESTATYEFTATLITNLCRLSKLDFENPFVSPARQLDQAILALTKAEAGI